MGYEQDFNLELFPMFLWVEMKYFSFMRYFLLVLVIWFYGMGIAEMADDGPHGIHFIRQTDGLAFSLHYWKFDAHFFEPGTLNVSTHNGKAACEFPIFYFITAKVFSIAGVDLSYLRLIHGLVAMLGVFALWGLSGFFTKVLGFRLLVVLSLFTSAVFNFYAFNFLPDMPAFSFALMGYYGVLVGVDQKSKSRFYLGILGFVMAGLLKVTFLIHPLALIMALAFNKKKFPVHILIFAVLFLLIPVFCWWSFVLQYNSAVGDVYFTTAPKAIWNLDRDHIYRVWEAISRHWRNSYFPKYSWYGLGGMLTLIVVFWKSIPTLFRIWFVLLLLGCSAYALLFWQQLEHHDYYFLNVLPFFLMVFLLFFSLVENKIILKKYFYVIPILFVAFTISSVVKASNKMGLRMSEQTEEEIPSLQALALFKNSKMDLKDCRHQTIWVIGEKTKNGVFVFLQTQGITQPDQFNLAFAKNAHNVGITGILILSKNEKAVQQLLDLGWRIIAEDQVNHTMFLDHP